MHSPFAFQFILQVLNNKGGFEPPSAIEELRQSLLRNKQVLQIEDLGAGSRLGASKQRTVRQLTKTAVKPKKYGHLFYRLVKYYQPSTILELGTSLGVTTAYMAAANASGQVITIEGSKAVYEVATQNFHQLHLTNIKAINANFDDVLSEVLGGVSVIDMAYIDGNHRYSPTINYFNLIRKKVHNNTILIFDDIHWSEEMERAWWEIRQHPSVRCSVDLFFLGIVFFREEFKEKQHFSVRF